MNNIRFYKVGGAVRDQFLGIKAKDIDYAVEAPNYEAMRDYIAAHGKIWQERPQFFTIRAQLNGENCDYVLCRKEGFYSDGRRPDSVEPGTIFDDLARRDFTCNAIALADDGSYIDPHYGCNDLKNGILRCVGNAEDRFNEDSLRLLRAMRFSITKLLKLDPAIVVCLDSYKIVNELDNVSIERIRDELHQCFMFNTGSSFRFLENFPILEEKIFSFTNLKFIPTIQPI